RVRVAGQVVFEEEIALEKDGVGTGRQPGHVRVFAGGLWAVALCHLVESLDASKDRAEGRVTPPPDKDSRGAEARRQSPQHAFLVLSHWRDCHQLAGCIRSVP